MGEVCLCLCLCVSICSLFVVAAGETTQECPVCVHSFDWDERLGVDLASLSDKAARKKQLKELARVRERLLQERFRVAGELAQVAHAEMRDASQNATGHVVLRMREAIGLSRGGRVFALRVGNLSSATEWSAPVQVPVADTLSVDVVGQDGIVVGTFVVTLAQLGPDLNTGVEVVFDTRLETVPGAVLTIGIRRK